MTTTPRTQHCRVSVRKKGEKKHTTVSLSKREFAQALGYTNQNKKAVRDAIRHVAEKVEPADVLPGDFSLVVRRKALARLRGQVRNPAVALAESNNAAWGG